MLLHINALTLFYYKIVLAVVPYKLIFYFFIHSMIGSMYFLSVQSH